MVESDFEEVRNRVECLDVSLMLAVILCEEEARVVVLDGKREEIRQRREECVCTTRG